MSHWPIKTLGELCDVRIGRTPRRDQLRFWGDGAVWVTVGELNGGIITRSKEQISDIAIRECMPEPVPTGTLLFSFKLSIGKMAVAGCPLYTNEAIAALLIRNSEKLSRDFLRFALLRESHEGTANTAVMGKVLNKEKVQQLSIPVPPLAEQERIVKLLDEADELRKLRTQADRRTADLIPALFHEMFGDPTHIDKMRWPFKPLGKFAVVSYGLAQKLDASTKPEDGTRILTISNVLLDGSIDTKVEKYSVVESAERTKARLQKSDLLFNWRNGSEQHVGKTAIWEEQIDGEVLHVSFLLKIRTDQNQANPYFLWALINRLRATGYFTHNARMQINRKFNASELSALKLPLPQLSLQQEFAQRVAEIRDMEADQAASKARLDALFQSLLHRVFEGEL